jgi:hypothetical protein
MESKPVPTVCLIAFAAAGTVAVSTFLVAQQPVVNVWPVQGNVSMLVGAGPNVAVQVGKDGVLIVDAPQAVFVPPAMAAVRTLSEKPLRYIVNTSGDAEHRDGTPTLVGANGGRGTGGAPFAGLGFTRPSVVAHGNVLSRLNPSGGQLRAPAAALPTTT